METKKKKINRDDHNSLIVTLKLRESVKRGTIKRIKRTRRNKTEKEKK